MVAAIVAGMKPPAAAYDETRPQTSVSPNVDPLGPVNGGIPPNRPPPWTTPAIWLPMKIGPPESPDAVETSLDPCVVVAALTLGLLPPARAALMAVNWLTSAPARALMKVMVYGVLGPGPPVT